MFLRNINPYSVGKALCQSDKNGLLWRRYTDSKKCPVHSLLICSWTQEGIFFVFAVGTVLDWDDHWASKECLLKWSQLLKINWVFLSIPSFALPPPLPPHPLISLVWVVIWKPGQIHSEPLLPNKQASNGCLPRVQEPLCVRKLNISDRQNGRRQITVALSRAIDWKEADVNCYQQPHMPATAFHKGIPTAWRKDSNQKPFCLSEITL